MAMQSLKNAYNLHGLSDTKFITLVSNNKLKLTGLKLYFQSNFLKDIFTEKVYI